MKKSAPKTDDASRLIDLRIAELGDWRGATLARVRAIVKQADPEVVEEEVHAGRCRQRGQAVRTELRIETPQPHGRGG